MTVGRDVERLIADWLIVEAVPRAPDRVLDGARRTIRSTTQRRAARAFRSAPVVTRRLRLFAIAAVIAVLIGGISVLAIGSISRRDVYPAPSLPPRPSTSPSASSRTPVPDAAHAARVPFTSSRFGYSMTLPQGTTVTSTDPLWPGALGPGAPSGLLNDLFGQSAQVSVVSWPIPPGMTREAWLAAYESAGLKSGVEPVCWPPLAQWEQLAVDGQPAWVHGDARGCSFTEVVVFVGRRLYKFDFDQHGNLPHPRSDLEPYLQSIRFNP